MRNVVLGLRQHLRRREPLHVIACDAGVGQRAFERRQIRLPAGNDATTRPTGLKTP